MSGYHVTAMLEEAVAMLACQPGKTIVDGTLGGCGHARRICEQIGPNGVLIGVDQDQDAIAEAHRVLPAEDLCIHIVHGNFVDLPLYLARLDIDHVDGILVDIGLSQHQLAGSGRGFSFQRDEPLDMRMDAGGDVTAADLVATLDARELARIFSRYGEERWSTRIARHLTARREEAAITTSGQLARLVTEAIPKKAVHTQKIHPATRVFQALRIAVNRELEVLEAFVDRAVDLLAPGGRLCVLSFHSLEDRIVKHRFRHLADPCTCPPAFPKCTCGQTPSVRLLTRKVMRPTKEEAQRNPMARSTRLRAVEKL